MDQKKPKEVRVYPFPEVVGVFDGWQLRHGSSSAMTRRRRVFMPLQDTAVAHNVRTLAMARAKWSPDRPRHMTTAGKDCLEAVEDYRLVLHLVQRSVDVSQGFVDDALAKAMVADMFGQNDVRGLSLFLVRHWTTAAGNIAADYINRRSGSLHDALKVVHMAVSNLQCSYFDYGDTVRVAEKIEDWLESLSDQTKYGDPKGLKSDAAGLLSKYFTDGLSGLDSGDNEGKDGADGRGNDESKTVDELCGKMVVEKPPRPILVRKGGTQRIKTSADVGVRLRNVWRCAVDGKIFTHTRTSSGGSVLIDASGSMSLSPRQIMILAALAPAVSVAVYSGSTNTGVLRELVRGGRRCKNEYFDRPSGGANVIDVPAIRDWLAKQQQPRIWVSDGFVTGINDRQDERISSYVGKLCRKSRVIRVKDTETAVRLFEIIEAGKYTTHPASAHGTFTRR